MRTEDTFQPSVACENILYSIYYAYCKNGTKSGEKCIASSIVEVIKSTGTFHLSYSLSIGLFYIRIPYIVSAGPYLFDY